MLKKSIALTLSLTILMIMITGLASSIEDVILTGDAYVDAHSMYLQSSDYSFAKEQRFASDIIENLNLFSKSMLNLSNIMSLDFDNEYALLLAAIFSSESLSPEQEAADIAKDQYSFLSKAKDLIEKSLIDDSTLNGAYQTVCKLQGKLDVNGVLSIADIAQVDQQLSLIDKALNQSFLKNLIKDISPYMEKVDMLKEALDIIDTFSDVMNFASAYGVYQRLEGQYQVIMRENLELAKSIGADGLVKQIQEYCNSYDSEDYKKDVLINILHGVKAVTPALTVTAATFAITITKDIWAKTVPKMMEKFLIGKSLGVIEFTTKNVGELIAGVQSLGGTLTGLQLGFLATDVFLGMDVYSTGYRLLHATAVFEQLHTITLSKAEEELRKKPSMESAKKFHAAFQLQKRIELIAYRTWKSWIVTSKEHIHLTSDKKLDAWIELTDEVEKILTELDCCKYEGTITALYSPKDNEKNTNDNIEIDMSNDAFPKLPNIEDELSFFIFDPYEEIARLPEDLMDAVLVMDISDSMNENGKKFPKPILNYAKKAASVFIEHTIKTKTDYRVALATFNSSARIETDFCDQSGVEAVLKPALQRLVATGKTDIAGGFAEASNLLQGSGRSEARQMIVLFSDGMQTMPGDPVAAGTAAMQDANNVRRDIYTIGMAGALSSKELSKMRKALNQPYATRYIEIDSESDLEGVLYLLSATNAANIDQTSNIIRIRGAANVEVISQSGERLSSKERLLKANFGTLFINSSENEMILKLEPQTYQIRVSGKKANSSIEIFGEVLNGRAVVQLRLGQWTGNANTGTRLEGDISFENSTFLFKDLSFDPTNPQAIDPFTGLPYEKGIGDIVQFGHYYSSSTKNKEPITWHILDVNDNKALLLSTTGLETRAYQNWDDTQNWNGLTWRQSSLRNYLNDEFLGEAFSQVEQQAICLKTIPNAGGLQVLDDGRTMMTLGGDDTQDKVFVLSVDEVLQYLPAIADRYAPNTKYLLKKPQKSPKKTDISVRPAHADKESFGYWWLRDINADHRDGYDETRGFHVCSDGTIGTTGVLWYSYYVVRPAIWVDLQQLD